MRRHDEGNGTVDAADATPSRGRGAAAEVGDGVRALAEPFVDEARRNVSFMVLAVLMVPVGLVVVAVAFVGLGALATLLRPTGVVATGFTIGGLIGVLAALFFTFRWLYRRMPRPLRAAYAAPTQQARRVTLDDSQEAPDRSGSPASGDRATGSATLNGLVSATLGDGSSLDASIDRLITGGGDLSIRYEKRHSLRLSLMRERTGLRVVGLIERSKSLRGLTAPTAANDRRSGTAGAGSPTVRLTELEAAGWEQDAKGGGLTRSWATDAADDRARVHGEVARTLSILSDGSGDEQRIRYTSEANGSVDPIVGLVLGVVGTVIGMVIGAIVVVLVGPGARSDLALVAGLAVGFVGGVITGVLGMYQAVEWADRLPAFRGRLANVALAGGLATSGATALIVIMVIARL